MLDSQCKGAITKTWLFNRINMSKTITTLIIGLAMLMPFEQLQAQSSGASASPAAIKMDTIPKWTIKFIPSALASQLPAIHLGIEYRLDAAPDFSVQHELAYISNLYNNWNAGNVYGFRTRNELRYYFNQKAGADRLFLSSQLMATYAFGQDQRVLTKRYDDDGAFYQEVVDDLNYWDCGLLFGAGSSTTGSSIPLVLEVAGAVGIKYRQTQSDGLAALGDDAQVDESDFHRGINLSDPTINIGGGFSSTFQFAIRLGYMF